MKHFLLYAGPFVNLLSIVPYIIDVIRKKTKPNIVSWVTWTILTAVGAAAVMAQAGFVSGLLPLSASICTLSIVLLGFKYGFAKYTRFDIVCQASALLGLALWAIFNSPLIALVAVIAIDAIAAMPTLLHAYKKPQEETWQTFAVGSFGALLTLISLSSYSVGKLAYPVYLALGNGGIAGTIIVMRYRRGLSLSRKAVTGTLHENV
jgi:hypothetical protein